MGGSGGPPHIADPQRNGGGEPAVLDAVEGDRQVEARRGHHQRERVGVAHDRAGEPQVRVSSSSTRSTSSTSTKCGTSTTSSVRVGVAAHQQGAGGVGPVAERSRRAASAACVPRPDPHVSRSRPAGTGRRTPRRRRCCRAAARPRAGCRRHRASPRAGRRPGPAPVSTADPISAPASTRRLISRPVDRDVADEHARLAGHDRARRVARGTSGPTSRSAPSGRSRMTAGEPNA